jgi:hypothetical protein
MQIFSKLSSQLLGYSVATLLSMGIVPAQAASPETAPDALTNTLEQIEQAATRQDVDQVIGFYSVDYRNADGLDRSAYGNALSELWSTSPSLVYEIELLAWDANDNGYVAETLTTISGVKQTGGRSMQVETKTRSRQYFQNNQIVDQEILSEQTTLSSGVNPPEVKVNLPETVMVGQSYNFDAIVQEPLGSDLLLGTVLEEPVSPTQFSSMQDLDLELLQAGGLFKVGRAPLSTEDRWISAVLIRGDGITIVTQRLQVIDPMASL